MADDQGKLTPAQKEAVKAFLERKGAVRACEACGYNSWAIGDHLVTTMVQSGNALTIGGPSYPQVMVVCSNCFNTRTHMAVPMNIMGEVKKDG